MHTKTLWLILDVVVHAICGAIVESLMFLMFSVNQRVYRASMWLLDLPFDLACNARSAWDAAWCRRFGHVGGYLRVTQEPDHMCSRCGCWLDLEEHAIEFLEWKRLWE